MGFCVGSLGLLMAGVCFSCFWDGIHKDSGNMGQRLF